MKVSYISAIRAIAVLVIGILLITYREQMMTWLTITIGVLFFISGLISCLSFYHAKDKERRIDVEGVVKQKASWKASVPLTAFGSMCIGLALALIPNTFIKWIAYILAVLLLIGAINQFINISTTRRYGHVPFFYWLFPTVTLVVAGFILFKPITEAALPLMIIGYLAVFYGIIEIVILLRSLSVKRVFESQNPTYTATPIEDDIQDVEAEEVE